MTSSVAAVDSDEVHSTPARRTIPRPRAQHRRSRNPSRSPGTVGSLALGKWVNKIPTSGWSMEKCLLGCQQIDDEICYLTPARNSDVQKDASTNEPAIAMMWRRVPDPTAPYSRSLYVCDFEGCLVSPG